MSIHWLNDFTLIPDQSWRVGTDSEGTVQSVVMVFKRGNVEMIGLLTDEELVRVQAEVCELAKEG